VSWGSYWVAAGHGRADKGDDYWCTSSPPCIALSPFLNFHRLLVSSTLPRFSQPKSASLRKQQHKHIPHLSSPLPLATFLEGSTFFLRPSTLTTCAFCVPSTLFVSYLCVSIGMLLCPAACAFCPPLCRHRNSPSALLPLVRKSPPTRYTTAPYREPCQPFAPCCCRLAVELSNLPRW
jgi:hypothetical protein